MPTASRSEHSNGEDWTDLGFDVDELDEFANTLFSECKGESQLSSFETALSFLRDVRGSRPTDHPYYTDSLKNLALASVVSLIWTAQISALDETVKLLEDASKSPTRMRPESDLALRQGLQVSFVSLKWYDGLMFFIACCGSRRQSSPERR